MNLFSKEALSLDTLRKTIAPARPQNSRARAARSVSLRGQKWRNTLIGYSFLLPSLAVFAVFLFYPLFKSVYLSVHATDPRGRVAGYVGLDNFAELFASERFYTSLKVTGEFMLLTVPTAIAVAIALAALTHQRLKGIRLFQFIFSLPVAMSVGTSSVIWLMLFHPSTGMLNYGLSLFGIKALSWLADPAWALYSVSLMTVWMNLGLTYIILLSGLQNISSDITDSAKIDGAGPFRTFVQIILPLLSPTVFFVAIVSVINSLQSFGQIHILTKGGPMQTTDVFVYSIYREAFVNFRFGIGSAQSLVLFAIILALTLLQFRWLERKVHYQ